MNELGLIQWRTSAIRVDLLAGFEVMAAAVVIDDLQDVSESLSKDAAEHLDDTDAVTKFVIFRQIGLRFAYIEILP